MKEKEVFLKMFFVYQQDKFYIYFVRFYFDKFQRGILLGVYFLEGNGILWGICFYSLLKYEVIFS